MQWCRPGPRCSGPSGGPCYVRWFIAYDAIVSAAYSHPAEISFWFCTKRDCGSPPILRIVIVSMIHWPASGDRHTNVLAR
jgi:hypothetical protein